MPEPMPKQRPAPITRQGAAPLLQAAFACMAANGVEKLTMRQVAEAADCSLGTMTYHFASKEVLVSRVFAEYILPMMQLRRARIRPFDPVAGLREDIKASLPFDEAAEQVWRVRLGLLHFSTGNPKFRALVQHAMQDAQDGLEKRYARLRSLHRLRSACGSRTLAIQTLLMLEGAGLNMLQARAAQRVMYGEQVLHWFDSLTCEAVLEAK